MRMSGCGYISLVVDNSGGGLIMNAAKNRSVDSDPHLVGLVPDFKKVVRRDSSARTPVAHSRHADTANSGRGCCATEGIHKVGNAVNGFHATSYSAPLNFVKWGISESGAVVFRITLDGVDQEVAIDALMAVALRLRAAREAVGRSQRSVCCAVRVQANTWNQWEKAKHQPDPFALSRFANLDGITLDWIYRGRTEALPGDLRDLVIQKYEAILEKEMLRVAS